jgi:hypothetical protein
MKELKRLVFCFLVTAALSRTWRFRYFSLVSGERQYGKIYYATSFPFPGRVFYYMKFKVKKRMAVTLSHSAGQRYERVKMGQTFFMFF